MVSFYLFGNGAVFGLKLEVANSGICWGRHVCPEDAFMITP